MLVWRAEERQKVYLCEEWAEEWELLLVALMDDNLALRWNLSRKQNK